MIGLFFTFFETSIFANEYLGTSITTLKSSEEY